MNVPPNCQAWKEMMESGDVQRHILRNIESDSCLSDEIERRFFERLAARGLPASSGEAWAFACATVRNDPDAFVCKGHEVPHNRFVTLFRLQEVSSLGYVIPQDVRDAKGYRDKGFADDSPEEDLLAFTDQYDGPVELGNLVQVVWVTDFAAINGDLNNLAEVANRLGITADRCVLCVYNRGETHRTLHVPRALDGIDHPRFRVVDDPSAKHGRTVPISGSPDEGLPEAVHRSCSIVPQRWELGKR